VTLTHQQLTTLLNLVQETEECEIDCEAVLARAARFIETIVGPHANLDANLREVAQHLRVCPECRDEVEAIIRAIRSDRDGQ
jgi:hypothetical protein